MNLLGVVASVLLATILNVQAGQESSLIQRYMDASTACGRAGSPVDEAALEEVFHEDYQAFLLHKDGTEEHIVTSRQSF